MANGQGGRRQGAGRPAYRPHVAEMREKTVQKLNRIVSGEKDPLSVLIGFVSDESLDTGTRMNAAAICLPYLYPKLSQMQIDSRSTVTHVDGAALLNRLNERIEKLASSAPPRMIEAVPDEDGDGVGAPDRSDSAPE